MVTVTRKSPFSGKENTMVLNVEPAVYAKAVLDYARGAYIQDAFHMLNADEREFIKTGITPAEWDDTFEGVE